jgi:cell division protein FtsQ
MDPRLRARRRAVHRAQGRRRLTVLVVVLGLLVVGGLAWLVLHTPLFAARSITVTGAVHETPARVIAQAGLGNDPPLIDVDGALAAARLEQLPWVRSASVRISWPDGVRVVVSEEVPRFVVASAGNTWTTLSQDGRVLVSTPTRPAGLLLLTVPVPPGRPGTTLGVKDAGALRVAATLPPSFVAQVTEVITEPGGWVRLSLTTPVTVDIGLPTQLEAKYEDVSAVLAGATLHTGDVIDVSIPRAVSVTPG